MVKRKRAAGGAIQQKLDGLEGTIRCLFEQHSARLERHEGAMRLLLSRIDPQITDERFDGWVSAEIDRRNTGKAELHGVPASIRAAHLDDLNAWAGNTFKRRLAAYRAAILSMADGDKRRDIGGRWPETKKPEFDLW